MAKKKIKKLCEEFVSAASIFDGEVVSFKTEGIIEHGQKMAASLQDLAKRDVANFIEVLQVPGLIYSFMVVTNVWKGEALDMGWLFPCLSELDDDQITKVLNAKNTVFGLVTRSACDSEEWVKSKLDKLDHNKFLQILSSNNGAFYGLVCGYSNDNWVIDKINNLDDDQLTQVLSSDGAIWELMHSVHKNWAIDKIKKLNDQQVVTILSASEAVLGLADTGHGRWVMDQLEKLGDEQVTQVLSAASAVWGLTDQTRGGKKEWGEWLVKRLDTLQLHQVARILSAPNAHTIMYHGHWDFVGRKQNEINAALSEQKTKIDPDRPEP